jgi:hypothetical protein
VAGAAVVSSGKASEVLKLVEAALDAIAQLVDGAIVSKGVLAGWVGRNDGLSAEVDDDLAKSPTVVGGIGDDVVGVAVPQQGWSLGHIADLAGREDEAQRSAQTIGEHVDFGGQSSSGTPQSLVLVPPFPVAAC